MDFVFDRTAEGRSIKNLTVIDDTTHEAVAIVAERAMGGNQVVRILDQIAAMRGLPKAIRTDNVQDARCVPTDGNSIACQSCSADRPMAKSDEQNQRRGSAAQGSLG